MRWIVPDSWTAEELKRHVGSDEVEVGMGESPLQDALAQDQPRVLVLPSSATGQLLIARINAPMIETQPQEPPRAQSEYAFQPSGFLGLSDEVVYEDEEPTPKKKRFWN